MSNARPTRALTLLPTPEPAPSRFELHRRETIESANLAMAASLTKRAADSAAKAASLMGTCSALRERREALRDGRDGWEQALREAHALLGEVLAEMGT